MQKGVVFHLISKHSLNFNFLCIFFMNRPFYQYSSHIEFIRFKEYHGMPSGYSLSIYALFGQKENVIVYFSGKHSTTIFFPVTIFL